MSREIKFRAWDHRLQYMFYDIQRTYEGLPYPDKEHDDEKYDQLNEEQGLQSFDSFLEVNQFEVMQYTGLKDKNGTEIYEGDIINYDGGKTDSRAKMEVKWSEYASYQLKAYKENWTYDLGECLQNSIEVIGNIYEHSNLLKEDSQ